MKAPSCSLQVGDMSGDASFLKGLGCSVSASVLFGFTPVYVQWLEPLNGTAIFSHRILFSVAVAIIILTLFKKWCRLGHAVNSVAKIAGLMVCSLIVGIQWWLFVWAPLNGYTLDVAMGYFLLPLTIVLTSFMFLREKVSTLQKVAIFAASCGALHELVTQGQLSWVVLLVSLTYPAYFLIKRKVGAEALSSFFLESLIVLLAIIAIPGIDFDFATASDAPSLWVLLPGLGLLNAISMLFYISASRQLPMGLFGLLSYLEPALIFLVGLLVLKDSISAEQWITNSMIWIAVLLVCIDSIKALKAET
ncbi:EamA family transporter RarD [Spongorhabdus nitratireducens]